MLMSVISTLLKIFKVSVWQCFPLTPVNTKPPCVEVEAFKTNLKSVIVRFFLELVQLYVSIKLNFEFRKKKKNFKFARFH